VVLNTSTSNDRDLCSPTGWQSRDAAFARYEVAERCCAIASPRDRGPGIAWSTSFLRQIFRSTDGSREMSAAGTITRDMKSGLPGEVSAVCLKRLGLLLLEYDPFDEVIDLPWNRCGLPGRSGGISSNRTGR
jgi:hypothetical protein